MKLKVVSYNIQSGKNDEDEIERSFDFCTEVLRDLKADIIGLNEVGRHAHGEIFPKLDFGCEPNEYIASKLGLNTSFAQAITTHDGCPYGNAVLTRFEILSSERVSIPDPPRTEKAYYETRCILKATLDVPGGLTVLSTHIGLADSEKRSAVSTLVSLIPTIKTPVILMGDFNMEPNDPILLPLYDVINDANGRAATPHSWPSNAKNHDKPARKIDYILVSSGIKVNSFETHNTKASDHLPVIAEIEL